MKATNVPVASEQKVDEPATHWWLVAREEHTIVGLVSPVPFGSNGNSLSDAQIVQTFWIIVVLELTLLAMLHSPQEKADGAIHYPPMLLEGFITAWPCAAAAYAFRQLFRWGNVGRREHAGIKREHDVVAGSEDRSKSEKHGQPTKHNQTTQSGFPMVLL